MNQPQLSGLQYHVDREALQHAIMVAKSLNIQSQVLLIETRCAEMMLQIMDIRMMQQRVLHRLFIVHTYIQCLMQSQDFGGSKSSSS